MFPCGVLCAMVGEAAVSATLVPEMVDVVAAPGVCLWPCGDRDGGLWRSLLE